MKNAINAAPVPSIVAPVAGVHGKTGIWGEMGGEDGF